MNLIADGFADFGEVGVFRQEAVAGMDGVGAGDFRCAEDVGNIAIAQCGFGRPHADRSSAARTCMPPASASEWMATVLMPSSLQARMTRSAISPRLATSTFLNTRLLRYGSGKEGLRCGFRIDQEERLAIFHGLGAFHQNLRDAPVHLRLNLVHQLHCFDDTQDLSFFHVIPFFDIGVGIGRRGTIERANDRRRDRDLTGGVLDRRTDRIRSAVRGDGERTVLAPSRWQKRS